MQNIAAFNRIQAELRRMPQAMTMEEIARSGQCYPRQTRRRYPDGSRIESQVDYPSSSYRVDREGNFYRVSLPNNWRKFEDNNNSVTFAPEGAFGNYQGRAVFTMERSSVWSTRKAATCARRLTTTSAPYCRATGT
jgi:hypothetical protein